MLCYLLRLGSLPKLACDRVAGVNAVAAVFVMWVYLREAGPIVMFDAHAPFAGVLPIADCTVYGVVRS